MRGASLLNNILDHVLHLAVGRPGARQGQRHAPLRAAQLDGLAAVRDMRYQADLAAAVHAVVVLQQDDRLRVSNIVWPLVTTALLRGVDLLCCLSKETRIQHTQAQREGLSNKQWLQSMTCAKLEPQEPHGLDEKASGTDLQVPQGVLLHGLCDALRFLQNATQILSLRLSGSGMIRATSVPDGLFRRIQYSTSP